MLEDAHACLSQELAALESSRNFGFLPTARPGSCASHRAPSYVAGALQCEVEVGGFDDLTWCHAAGVAKGLCMSLLQTMELQASQCLRQHVSCRLSGSLRGLMTCADNVCMLPRIHISWRCPRARQEH